MARSNSKVELKTQSKDSALLDKENQDYDYYLKRYQQMLELAKLGNSLSLSDKDYKTNIESAKKIYASFDGELGQFFKLKYKLERTNSILEKIHDKSICKKLMKKQVKEVNALSLTNLGLAYFKHFNGHFKITNNYSVAATCFYVALLYNDSASQFIFQECIERLKQIRLAYPDAPRASRIAFYLYYFDEGSISTSYKNSRAKFINYASFKHFNALESCFIDDLKNNFSEAQRCEIMLKVKDFNERILKKLTDNQPIPNNLNNNNNKTTLGLFSPKSEMEPTTKKPAENLEKQGLLSIIHDLQNQLAAKQKKLDEVETQAEQSESKIKP